MDQEKIVDWLSKGCEQIQLVLTDQQVRILAAYAEKVLATNETMNLTRITALAEFAIKHYVDSLSCLKAGVDLNSRGIDVGTGAGFPGLVLAVHNRQSNVTLLDSLEKRVKFLVRSSEELKIDNVECIHGRAEDLGQRQSRREKYDWAVARAVAPLPVLLELCIPFVKKKGSFIAMKSGNVSQEIDNSQRAAEIMGAELAEVRIFELPYNMGLRSLVLYRKVEVTPNKYPRKPGVPQKRSL